MLTLWLAWLSEVNSRSNGSFTILTSLKFFYLFLLLHLYSGAQTMKMILWVVYPILNKAYLFQVLCFSLTNFLHSYYYFFQILFFHYWSIEDLWFGLLLCLPCWCSDMGLYVWPGCSSCWWGFDCSQGWTSKQSDKKVASHCHVKAHIPFWKAVMGIQETCYRFPASYNRWK